MAFDGVPIGISDGLPKNRRFCRVSGGPGLENVLGAVEMLVVPSDRRYFDSPTFPASAHCYTVLQGQILTTEEYTLLLPFSG